MDTDRAYLLGFIIGGGIFGNAENRLRIRLPYKQWGSYKTNPTRVSDITRDIMNVVNPLFKIFIISQRILRQRRVDYGIFYLMVICQI